MAVEVGGIDKHTLSPYIKTRAELNYEVTEILVKFLI